MVSVNEARAQASVDRQSRSRYLQISADLAPKVGIGDIAQSFATKFSDGEFKLPMGVRYVMVGESENFEELTTSLIFVSRVRRDFYLLGPCKLVRSFVTPFTIILTLPLSLCGAFILRC